MQESSVQSDSGVTDIQPAVVTDLADVPKMTDHSDSPKVINLDGDWISATPRARQYLSWISSGKLSVPLLTMCL